VEVSVSVSVTDRQFRRLPVSFLGLSLGHNVNVACRIDFDRSEFAFGYFYDNHGGHLFLVFNIHFVIVVIGACFVVEGVVLVTIRAVCQIFECGRVYTDGDAGENLGGLSCGVILPTEDLVPHQEQDRGQREKEYEGHGENVTDQFPTR